jgi:rubrerythrin
MTEVQAPLTRGKFIANAAKGSVLLVGTGGVLATMDGVAFAKSRVTASDVTALQVAYVAETLAVYIYSAILRDFHKITHPRLMNRDYFQHALENERAHKALLHKALGPKTPKKFSVHLPAKYTKSGHDILVTGAELELAFVKTYLGAVGTLSSVELKQLAAKIAADEATHFSFFDAQAGNGSPFGGHAVLPAVPGTITITEAADTLTKLGFIKVEQL